MSDVAADKGKSGDAHPGLGSIAWVFARYANFTLGGGSATISVLHRELFDKRRWISPDDFTLCFALARLTPGTYVVRLGLRDLVAQASLSADAPFELR